MGIYRRPFLYTPLNIYFIPNQAIAPQSYSKPILFLTLFIATTNPLSYSGWFLNASGLTLTTRTMLFFSHIQKLFNRVDCENDKSFHISLSSHYEINIPARYGGSKRKL